MTLSEKQQKFALLVCSLIEWADKVGYKVTFGEAYRTAHEAQWEAEQGRGIARSLHTIRLAIDLNLFKNGTYLTATEDYQLVGEYWESLDPECAWGGRFSKPDGNHFSLSNEGIK